MLIGILVIYYPGFVVAAYTGNLQYELTEQTMSLGSGNEAKNGFPFMNNKHNFYIKMNVFNDKKKLLFLFQLKVFETTEKKYLRIAVDLCTLFGYNNINFFEVELMIKQRSMPLETIRFFIFSYLLF